MRRSLLIFATLLPIFAPASRVPAATYVVTDLGESVLPLAINNLGQIAGDYSTLYGPNQSFFWDTGVVTPIVHPNGDEVRIRDLNSLGQIVGAHRDVVGRDHAFVWDRAAGWKNLEPPDVNYSWASGINDSGVIAGELFGQAVIWQPNGDIIRLGDLGGGYSDAMAINSLGEVVGLSALDPTGLHTHAFIWRENSIQDLGVVESITKGFQEYAIAFDVNDHGQAVGMAVGYNSYLGPEVPDHGFIWDTSDKLRALLPNVHFYAVNNAGQTVGEMFVSNPKYGPDIWGAALYENGSLYNLNDLIPETNEFYLTSATGINEVGQIIAYGNILLPSPDGQVVHGYLLTPVPEPSASFLALLALLVAPLGCRRITIAVKRAS